MAAFSVIVDNVIDFITNNKSNYYNLELSNYNTIAFIYLNCRDKAPRNITYILHKNHVLYHRSNQEDYKIIYYSDPELYDKILMSLVCTSDIFPKIINLICNNIILK